MAPREQDLMMDDNVSNIIWCFMYVSAKFNYRRTFGLKCMLDRKNLLFFFHLLSIKLLVETNKLTNITIYHVSYMIYEISYLVCCMICGELTGLNSFVLRFSSPSSSRSVYTTWVIF